VRWAVGDPVWLVQGFAGVGPLKGMGHCLVVVSQKVLQLGFQIRHRGEVSPANHLPHDDSKDGFDLVQPRTVFGQEHKADAMRRIRQERTPTHLIVQHAGLPLFFPAADPARNAGQSTPPVPPTSGCSGRPQ